MAFARTLSRRRRFPALFAVILTSIGLAACLPEPELRAPELPALPVQPVETAELAPLVDIWPYVDALMVVVRSPRSPEWYDTLWPAITPLRQSHKEQAAVPALSAALGDPDLAVRRNAAFALAALARKWWEEQPRNLASALIAGLADDDAQVREFAARGLRFIPSDPTLEAELIAAARDPSARVRWAAVTALSRRDRSDAVAAALFRAFDDPDPRTRYAAAFGLPRFLAASPARREQMVDGLIARMAASDAADRRVAADQMGLSGLHAGERHLPALIALAGSADPAIRRRATSEITSQLLRQDREGALDRDLLAAQLRRHQADLRAGDGETRAHAIWSLRGLRELDSSSLPDIEAALAVETDYDIRWALSYVRSDLAGEDPDYSDEQGWIYYRDMCLPHEQFAILGLRPWDDEHKVWDRLGEPERITAGTSEDDGGTHIVLTYEYPTLEIEIARTYAQRIATRSPTVIAGGLRVGITRQEALILLGVAPNPEALAARRFVVGNCDNAAERALNLDFGDDGRVATMAIEGYGP